MAYTPAPFNPTTPYTNQVATELNLANQNFTILSHAFLNNDPTTGVIKSNVYTFRRVDLSNASSDYLLQVGEEAIINFTNATSVSLYIATQNGTYYEMDIVSSNAVGTSGDSDPVYLNPNNTTYSNAFIYEEIYRDTSGQSSNNITYNAFRIGWTFTSARVYITNFTTNKHINELYSTVGIPSSPSINISSCYWNDTTTAWTSLGTITFPQTSSGYILIRRLA